MYPTACRSRMSWRREERLQKLALARAKIAARAKDRFEREQAAYDAKLVARRWSLALPADPHRIGGSLWPRLHRAISR